MDGQRSARDEALAVPEILEMILLQLDMQTLLVSAERVCQNWRVMIAASISLQRHLFFQEDEEAAPRHNPLLAGHFSFCFRHAVQLGSIDEAYYSLTTLTMHNGFDGPVPSDVARVQQGRAAYGHPQASWKRMFVSQPAIRGIGGVFTRESDELYSAQPIQPMGTEPVTMPMLLRAALVYFGCVDNAGNRIFGTSGSCVMWYQLPQTVREWYPVPSDFGIDPDDRGTGDAANMACTFDENHDDDGVTLITEEEVKIRHAFESQMEEFGMLVHVNYYPLSAQPDSRYFIYFDIMNAEP